MFILTSLGATIKLLGQSGESNLRVTAALLLLMAAAAAELTTFQLLPLSFSPSSLSSYRRGGEGQGGGTQQALPGTQVVFQHRAVLVALMTGAVHFIITEELLGENNEKASGG